MHVSPMSKLGLITQYTLFTATLSLSLSSSLAFSYNLSLSCQICDFCLYLVSTSNDVNIGEPETRVLSPEKPVPAEVADARARRTDLGHLDRVVCWWGWGSQQTSIIISYKRWGNPTSKHRLCQVLGTSINWLTT